MSGCNFSGQFLKDEIYIFINSVTKPNTFHMETNTDYHFSLFQPFSEHGRKIRNLILTMLTIWAVCVFGFQILLKVVEKPVPEATLISFDASYASLQNGHTDQATVRDFMHSLVLTAGKVGVKPADRWHSGCWFPTPSADRSWTACRK